MTIDPVKLVTTDGTQIGLRSDLVTVGGLKNGTGGLSLYVEAGQRTANGAGTLGTMRGNIVSGDADGNSQNDLGEVFSDALAATQADDPSFPSITTAQFHSFLRAICHAGAEKLLDISLAT